MYKVSELIAKPLISLCDAGVVGTVGNITFDEKLKNGRILTIFNDDGDEAELRYVELRRVAELTFDAAVVKNTDCLTTGFTASLKGAPNPINCEAFNQDGKRLGTVRDILMEGCKVAAFVVGEEEIAADTLLSYSDRLLIFNDTGAPVKLARPKKRFPAPAAADTRTVSVDEGNARVDVPAKIPPSSTLVTRTPAPEGTAPSYGFLTGKRLNKSIFDAGGRLLVKENTIITDDVINLARSEGKLVQLALHAVAV